MPSSTVAAAPAQSLTEAPISSSSYTVNTVYPPASGALAAAPIALAALDTVTGAPAVALAAAGVPPSPNSTTAAVAAGALSATPGPTVVTPTSYVIGTAT